MSSAPTAGGMSSSWGKRLHRDHIILLIRVSMCWVTGDKHETVNIRCVCVSGGGPGLSGGGAGLSGKNQPGQNKVSLSSSV